jgi:hypothetical protein
MMKGKNLQILLCIFLWTGLYTSSAQCSSDILKIAEQYSSEQFLGEGEVYEYNITLKIKPEVNSRQVKTTSKMSLVIGRNIYVNKSEFVTLYADSTQMFSVMKSSNSIVWQDMGKKGLFGYSSKELFKNVDSSYCNKVVIAGVSYTKITCLLSKAFAEPQMIDRVEYWVDALGQKLYKAKVSYKAKSGLEYIEMIYDSIKKSPCPDHLKGNIKNLFFEKGTKVLRASYKGFQLRDQRKHKK